MEYLKRGKVKVIFQRFITRDITGIFVFMGIEHVLKVKTRGVDDATGGEEATDNNSKRDDSDEGETFYLCINKLL